MCDLIRDEEREVFSLHLPQLGFQVFEIGGEVTPHSLSGCTANMNLVGVVLSLIFNQGRVILNHGEFFPCLNVLSRVRGRVVSAQNILQTRGYGGRCVPVQ